MENFIIFLGAVKIFYINTIFNAIENKSFIKRRAYILPWVL